MDGLRTVNTLFKSFMRITFWAVPIGSGSSLHRLILWLSLIKLNGDQRRNLRQNEQINNELLDESTSSQNMLKISKYADCWIKLKQINLSYSAICWKMNKKAESRPEQDGQPLSADLHTLQIFTGIYGVFTGNWKCRDPTFTGFHLTWNYQ